MTEFVQRMRHIYDRHPNRIHPYIGASFKAPVDASLRVMGIGINSHCQEKDFAALKPEAYGLWFEQQAFRYQKSVRRDLTDVGARITQGRFLFSGHRFNAMDSMFLTNAVKVYVKDSEGKRADQLSDGHFKAHLGQWHDELDTMAEHGVLPHVIAIIGRPFWGMACASFGDSAPFKQFRVKSYRSCKGKSLHYANRITVAGSQGDHELLLMRLRHPSGRAPAGSPKWLFEQEDFRKLATA